MSVSRRASFAAGIAAARRERRGGGGGVVHRRLRDIEGGSSFEDQGDDSGTVVTTTTTSTTLRMASSVKDSANAINVDTSGGSVVDKGGGGAVAAMPFDMSNMAKMAGIAGAALAAEKTKPKMSVEVRPFTKESLEKINLRTSNLIRDYGFLPKRQPHLLDGAQLPPKFEPFPSELLGKPVEELDQYVYEKTFCVVSRRFNKNYVQRFSATRAMFIFPPWNIFRCIAIYLSTNQLFDYCVMFTILINCVFLAMSETNEEAEYIFLAIYSLESLIKCIAKGFILNNYTYLRSPWNWLDFLVILSGYLTSFIEMGNLAGLRTFRVLRALKTISILPSLRTIINALLNAVKQLAEVMTLTIFCLMVFALFALQVYMGQLRNKCVLDIEQYDEGNGPKNWTEWVLNEDNWFIDDKGNPELCGNATGAKSCPEGYVCLPNVGGNPNYGYTSFDNLLWSMLTTFQLITLDYWENVYNKIVATGGPMHVIFFTIVVFFGSFYLINLMLAVVAMSYEEEAEANNAERAKEAEEAAALNQNKPQQPEEEECTIRTNAPQMIYGSVSPEDMCGQCSKNSKEALERGRASSHSGRSFEASKANGHEECSGNRVVIKARQVGSEIHSLDLHSNYDPHNPQSSFYKGDTYENRFHSSLDASSIGGVSVDEGKRRNQLLSPTMEEGQGFYHSDDQYSLSNYSSGGFSNKSSLNDSGVVGDQEMDSVSEDKLRLQDPKSDLDGEIINCKDKANGKRISNTDHPLVVSIETTEDRNCAGCRRCCISYSCWLKFQDFLFKVVHTTLIETTVTLCIILNTAFLAIEHHGMSQELDETLETGNKVFTAFFTLEASLKLLAMSKEYFSSGWNIFDLIIVVASLIDLSVESVNGISVLRGMRLMRVLKLAQSWTTMKVLLSIIISTLGALGNLTFLLIIVIYIFAVLGMQLFGKTYTEENFYPDPVPRWNFTDFFHSFMMIFRILCGEWIEPLWDCMRAEARLGVAESCLAIFLPALVVGNFMVLNLFLALLLNSFNCEELKSRKEEVKSEGGSAVASKFNKVKDKLTWKKKKNSLEDSKSQKFSSNGSLLSQNGLKPTLAIEDEKAGAATVKTLGGEHQHQKQHQQHQPHESQGGLGDECTAPIFSISRPSVTSGEHNPASMDSRHSVVEPSPHCIIEKGKSLTFDEALAGAEMGDTDPEAEVKSKIPDQCCPLLCGKIFWCCDCLGGTCLDRAWSKFRQVIHDIVDNPFFEWTILLLIFASSLSLCFEDINLQDNEELMFILKIVNMVFAVLFTIEMVLKWIAFGLWRYFTSAWTCLDFVIVCVSILSLAVEGSANLTALRSLRTLRALRPLRAISRWQGMKIVVNALMYAIPSIFNVLLVCLVFWLIFSIMGVQFFGGKFYKCVDESGDRLPIEVVDNKYQCLDKNYSWINSKITFDHVGHAYLALFQVATFEGWMEVMADAVDCREVDQQPSYEASKYNYFYFVIFIVCGSFFTLNLFIGVIIDNFNALKKKYEGGVLEMFLTESQKNYYTAMKKLGRKKPQKVVRRPTNEMHALFYDISLSRRFEIAIFVLIFLNMVTMGIEHYNQSRVITFTLEISNALFTTIFSLECLVKIVGLRFQYFTVGWNIFDFVLVIASIIGIVMEDMMEDFPVSPTLLRVVRVFRIGRILRLIKAAKGIRKLLFALIVSLPALFNIGALLALITFIYAIIGMTLFGHVKHQGALNDQVNFETFGRSMQLLFRLVTSAGWNDVLEPLLVTPPDCDDHYKDLPNGNCGHPFVAIIFFVSFIIINFMIVINMYIAIILENFNQAHQEEEIGIVEEDLEMFYTKWAKFDPHATQFISFHQMSDFIASLDAPLGIPKPNLLALVSFDLPIAKGDKIHCLDVLHSLTKYTLGFIDDNSEDFSKLAGQMDEKFKKQFPTRKELEIVSSTREWKKLDNAARIIQKFFKVYVQGVNIEERIDIHTQTFGQTRKPPPPRAGVKPVTQVGGTGYLPNEPEMGSDTEWKTQSLPSLGHVSSDNTLESSAEDYAPERKISQKRNKKKSKRDPPSVMSDEGDGMDDPNRSDHFDPENESEDKPILTQPRHHSSSRGREMQKTRGGSEDERDRLRHQYQTSDYIRDTDRDYPKHQSRDYPKDHDRDYPKDQRDQRRDYMKDPDRDYHHKDSRRDYPKDQGRDYPRDKERDYSKDHEYLPKDHGRDYSKEMDRDYPQKDSESDYHWDRRDPRRERDSFQSRDFEAEEKPWDRKERYRDKHMMMDYSPVTSGKADTYRRLPQRPQSFAAADSVDTQLPRRKLPQVPIRTPAGRPSSYIQTNRYRSLDEDRSQQPSQYHSNPHLSVGGHLPTHYESYYHELRLTEPHISPHSSLRQLPPTPSEMVTGHRRTASSGSFGRQQREEPQQAEVKYPGHRFSYQEGDSASTRLNRYGMGGHRNFSSLPRNHGGAVHYKDDLSDYYRSMAHHDPSPKRVALMDDPFISYPDEHDYPLLSAYSGADEDLDTDLLLRRRRQLLEDPLVDDLDDPTVHFPQHSAAFRESQRYSSYVDEEMEKALRSPDYYEYEARYTQSSTADPRSSYKMADRITLPTLDTYLERSPTGGHRHSQEYHGAEAASALSPNLGYKDWEPRHEPSGYSRDHGYDRDPVGSMRSDDHRIRVKQQLSWEQYSQDDPSTDDLKYVVSEPGPSHRGGEREEGHQRHSRHEKSSSSSKSKQPISPAKKRHGESSQHHESSSHRHEPSHESSSHRHESSSHRREASHEPSHRHETSHETPSDDATRQKEKPRRDKTSSSSKSRVATATTDDRKARRHKKSSTGEGDASTSRRSDPKEGHSSQTSRPGPSSESQHRSDPSRRSIRRQPRVGAGAPRERRGGAETGAGAAVDDAFDDDGLFHFEDSEAASMTEAKPNRRKK